MRKEFVSFIVAVTVVGFFGSTALALDPIGPPVAGCKQNQFSAGFEFAFGEMDLEVSGPGISTANNREAVLKDVESRKYFARIGYGLSDDWEIFTRLGVADAEVEGDSGYPDFDSDHEFAFGVGTKKTFIDNGDVKWGAVFQFSWAELDDRYNSESLSFANGAMSSSYVTKVELDWYEIQLALGPSWMVDEGIYLYGGPFLHFLEGDIDVIAASSDGTRYEHELEQESEFGGFVGCLFEIDPHIVAGVEGQLMSDAWLLAAGVTWLF